MGSVSGQWRFFCALFYLSFVAFIHGLKEITAELGQTVNLTCRGQDDITGLVLTRSDLDPKYVFVFRDNRPDLTKQNKQFEDRVKLPGPLVANDDGNVVLYLSNVSWSDNGTYSCQVHKRGERPVETSIDVRVIEPGGGTTPTDDPLTEEPPTGDPQTGDPFTEEPPTEGTFINKFYLILMYGFVVFCVVTYILVNDHFVNRKTKNK